MRVALILTNVVHNIIETETVPDDYFGYDFAVESSEANIGDMFVAGAFISSIITYTPDTLSILNPVPELQAFQAKAALAQFGLLDDVEAFMATADVITRLRWQEAPSFKRDNSALIEIATELGMTSNQLDDLFELGATIVL